MNMTNILYSLWMVGAWGKQENNVTFVNQVDQPIACFSDDQGLDHMFKFTTSLV